MTNLEKNHSCGNCGNGCPTKHPDFVIDTQRKHGGVMTPEGKEAYKIKGYNPCSACEKKVLETKNKINKQIPDIEK